jgi:hypothetical protein
MIWLFCAYNNHLTCEKYCLKLAHEAELEKVAGNGGADLAHVGGQRGEALAAHQAPRGSRCQAHQYQDVEGDPLRVARHISGNVRQNLSNTRANSSYSLFAESRHHWNKN